MEDIKKLLDSEINVSISNDHGISFLSKNKECKTLKDYLSKSIFLLKSNARQDIDLMFLNNALALLGAKTEIVKSLEQQGLIKKGLGHKELNDLIHKCIGYMMY